MLEVGIQGKESMVVEEKNTAKKIGSGTLDVLATPAMIALMEKTAWVSVAKELEEGCGTVGNRMEVTHDAPTPLGMMVTCESRLVAVEGRKLTFDVRAYDEVGEIGKGVHERFIIKNESFQKKANGKGR